VSKSIHLSLVFHNHQPVGNFGFVFERAMREAYEPMIRLLEKHPGVKVGLHYSGCLLDWMFEHDGELIERIRALVGRGQVEILTGGYYEPILVAIPDRDKYGQIKKLSETVRREFGYEPVGAWLAERVWEQHLAKNFHEAGVRYTIVDDTHFRYAGVKEEDLFGYYITEEQGKSLAIFSTLKALRYSIPWSDVDSVIGWLIERADESGKKLALMGDDGEKFGMWPGTYEHCWGTKEGFSWMEMFFSKLEEKREIIKTLTPAEYLKRFPPLGRIYLPTASYDEMTEWVLPVELGEEFAWIKQEFESSKRKDVLRFLRGGFWRNFMVKYPEINTMHKKMLYVSGKIARYVRDTLPRGGKTDVKRVQDYLWAGQCNCPYWHGVFGGIYLFHIRSAVYENLIKAEKYIDEISGNKTVKLEVTDFDCDGEDEILFEGSRYNFYVGPSIGGGCFEWDWRDKNFNLLNTLTRRKEAYHSGFLKAVREDNVIFAGSEEEVENIHTQAVRVKELGLERRLFYDPHRRLSFVDHFVPWELDSNGFYSGNYNELGDFVDSSYEIVETVTSGSGAKIVLVREGTVVDMISRAPVPVKIVKSYILYGEEGRLELSYSITNEGRRSIDCGFGVETSWAMMGGNDHESFLSFILDSAATRHFKKKFYLDEIGKVEHVIEVLLYLKLLAMKIDMVLVDTNPDFPNSLHFYPIETISNSEGGFERIYQGISLIPVWRIKLSPGDVRNLGLEIVLSDSGSYDFS